MEIPKLLLQPLVENSIVHGMGDTMDTLTIRIFAGKMKVRGIGEMTVISIRDNGVGFEIKKLEEMNERVGVVNVRDRAELYWKDVVYQVQSRPGQGCTTTIAFPVGKESRI